MNISAKKIIRVLSKRSDELILLLLLLLSTTITAQRRIVSPERFGPNALPIPELKTGKLAEDFNFKIAYESHTSEGDDTQNAFLELYIPVVSKRVALVLSMVPYENYSLSPETAEIRNISGTASGTAKGDIYVGTHIQILKDKTNLPDVMLSIDLKTASGNNAESARFTDTPGYIFDLSAGKDIHIENSFLQSVRPFAVAGFFVYQTNREVYRQNDAFLYGLGLDLNFKKLKFSTAYGGYHGYIEDGDRPNVWRSSLRTLFNSAINYEIRFGKGFDSNFYDALRLGIHIDLNFLKDFI